MKKIFLSLFIISLVEIAHAQTPPSCVTNPVPGCVLTLEWTDNSDNEDWFEVERRINSTLDKDFATFDKASSISGQTGIRVSYTDKTLGSSCFVKTVYDYRVVAVNKAGKSGPTNVVTVTMPPLPNAQCVPAAPSNLIGK